MRHRPLRAAPVRPRSRGHRLGRRRPLLRLRARAALGRDDRSLLLRLIEYDDKLAPIFYIPAVVIVLAAGIGLVIDGPWGFGDGWVVAGIVLLVGAFVLGVGFIVPTAKRLHATVADSGPESAATGSVLGRFRALSWIDAAVLVAAVFVMTAKPF